MRPIKGVPCRQTRLCTDFTPIPTRPEGGTGPPRDGAAALIVNSLARCQPSVGIRPSNVKGMFHRSSSQIQQQVSQGRLCGPRPWRARPAATGSLLRQRIRISRSSAPAKETGHRTGVWHRQRQQRQTLGRCCRRNADLRPPGDSAETAFLGSPGTAENGADRAGDNRTIGFCMQTGLRTAVGRQPKSWPMAIADRKWPHLAKNLPLRRNTSR